LIAPNRQDPPEIVWQLPDDLAIHLLFMSKSNPGLHNWQVPSALYLKQLTVDMTHCPLNKLYLWEQDITFPLKEYKEIVLLDIPAYGKIIISPELENCPCRSFWFPDELAPPEDDEDDDEDDDDDEDEDEDEDDDDDELANDWLIKFQ